MDSVMKLLDPNNPILYVIMAWSLIWKGIALWNCGRNKQLGWYLAIFILNTLGILEIIYLIFFRENKNYKGLI